MTAPDTQRRRAHTSTQGRDGSWVLVLGAKNGNAAHRMALVQTDLFITLVGDGLKGRPRTDVRVPFEGQRAPMKRKTERRQP
jgi:hypothetical protein